MKKKEKKPDYRPIMVGLFFVNKLCLHVNPMRGEKHRMIYEYEKILVGQFCYHNKDDHGLRVDGSYDFFQTCGSSTFFRTSISIIILLFKSVQEDFVNVMWTKYSCTSKRILNICMSQNASSIGYLNITKL